MLVHCLRWHNGRIREACQMVVRIAVILAMWQSVAVIEVVVFGGIARRCTHRFRLTNGQLYETTR